MYDPSFNWRRCSLLKSDHEIVDCFVLFQLKLSCCYCSLSGAAMFQDCVVHVNGTLTFANNTGSSGGALFMRSSQIKLHHNSKLVFLGNKARGLGGAIFVLEHQMDEFIHAYNPDCFLAYIDPLSPPSQWKVCSLS